MSILFGNACFSNLKNKIKLITENVEALTNSYESKMIDGDLCYATEMGIVPSQSYLSQMSPNTVLYKHFLTTVGSNDQDFWNLGTLSLETLSKCNANCYGYAVANGEYCWIESYDLVSGSITVGAFR